MAATLSSNQSREDLIEALAALHEDDLNLPFLCLDAVGDPVFGLAGLEMMGAQVLERRMQR
jgi:hypothetical protein